jgi:RimJ/RimL family protein N-acetyltransferase
LEPLAAAHEPELRAAADAPEIFQFTSSSAHGEACARYLAERLQEQAAGRARPFAVRRLSSGEVVGFTQLKEWHPAHRRAVVGSWYTPRVWRQGVNPEAKLLLLDFAFGPVGCLRVEFRTHSANLRSRAALEKLGAVCEGVLRAHQLTRAGERRDSAVYSILAEEWPRLRAALLARLQWKDGGRDHPGH